MYDDPHTAAVATSMSQERRVIRGRGYRAARPAPFALLGQAISRSDVAASFARRYSR
jgi:hypothetical protein